MPGSFTRAVVFVAHQRAEAAEGRTQSKTLRARGAAEIRASVLECVQLWRSSTAHRPTFRYPVYRALLNGLLRADLHEPRPDSQ